MDTAKDKITGGFTHPERDSAMPIALNLIQYNQLPDSLAPEEDHDGHIRQMTYEFTHLQL